jgi:hypothetical protein
LPEQPLAIHSKQVAGVHHFDAGDQAPSRHGNREIILMPLNLRPHFQLGEPRLGVNQRVAVSDQRQGTKEILKVRRIALGTRVKAHCARLEVTDDLRPNRQDFIWTWAIHIMRITGVTVHL